MGPDLVEEHLVEVRLSTSPRAVDEKYAGMAGTVEKGLDFLWCLRGTCNGVGDGVVGVALELVQAREGLGDFGGEGHAVVPVMDTEAFRLVAPSGVSAGGRGGEAMLLQGVVPAGKKAL